MKALIIRMERSYRRGFAQGFARAETGEMNLEDVKAWHLRGINQRFTVEEDPLTGRIHQEEIPTVLGRFAELQYREGYLQGCEASERKALNKTEVRHYRARGAQRNWLVMEDPITRERLDPKIIIENIVEKLNLTFVESTKYNDIYENRNHVFIFHKLTGQLKVKAKDNQINK